jgi:cob(I)alamin adenosyltransferase
MVHLTKIYTKTGDKGGTSIANGMRVNKISPLVNAIGTVDEANSAIGVSEFRNNLIDRIQNDLFDLGADLACSPTVKITQERIDWLETTIDTLNKYLEPLHSFVLPTGTLHHARTIVRRAERDVWLAIEIHSTNDDMQINPLIPVYLNRLSDLLFVMARYHNVGAEKLWVPLGDTENVQI